MEKDTKIVVPILIAVIVILVGIVLYAFVIKPAINSYVVNAQIQGYQYAILSIMQQASTCQSIPLTFNNQTINFIAVECLQQAQQTSQK